MKASILASISIAAAALLAGWANPALAQDLPTFERDGLPVTLHQVQILGSQRVHGQPAISALMQDGMPASPHQLAVLRHSDRPASG